MRQSEPVDTSIEVAAVNVVWLQDVACVVQKLIVELDLIGKTIIVDERLQFRAIVFFEGFFELQLVFVVSVFEVEYGIVVFRFFKRFAAHDLLLATDGSQKQRQTIC
jgi:hypothetical protein